MGVALQIEKLAHLLPELREVLPVQYAETGDPDLPCNPIWLAYEKLEELGVLTIVTMRDDGRLAGYATCMFHPHPNSGTVKVGTVPTFWVEPRPNRAFLLRSLLQGAVDTLWSKGAAQVSIETEPAHSCGRLLQAMGAEVGKISYCLKRQAAKQEAVNA